MVKTWEEFNNDSLNEDLSDLQNEYREYFKFMLYCYDTTSPSKLSEEKKKEFFGNIKKYWVKGKGVTKDLEKIKMDICGETERRSYR